MGACATKSGDLKVKGEPPVVAEDAVTALPVAEAEKTKADGVPVAAEADPADVSRRRSLSDLLREEAEASDGEAGREAVKVVKCDEGAAVATDEAGAEANDGEAGQVAVKVVTDEGAAVATTDEAEANDGEAGQVAVKVVTDEGAAVSTDEAGAEASDGEAALVAVQVVTDEGTAVATTEEPEAPANLSKEEGEKAAETPQVSVEPSATAVEHDTTEQEQLIDDDPKSGQGQEPGGEAKAEEEEKRVDPDSVQIAAAPTPSAEGSQVADGASA